VQSLSLVARQPEVTGEHLRKSLVPPPQFARVSFDSYLADPAQPSQAAAVAATRAFAKGAPAPKRRRMLRRAEPPESRPGIYLDGGFGVGKTHLLAAIWHDHPGPKAFGTFVEYTNLVGMLGFAPAVETFRGYRLVAIDEFELDDPGDTVLMSTFLSELVRAGVRLAATSNTLPDRLGEGRFAAEDFLREIQGLSAHFEVIRIEGQDYRHRGEPLPAPVLSRADIDDLAERPDTSVDNFSDLLHHLRTVHPAKYGELVRGVSTVCVTDVHPLTDQADALRLVVLVDRLYDQQAAVAGTGHSLTAVFAPEMLTGGYRKKYFRALSRLSAMAARPAADLR
jgi:cell division protein ZapE